MARRFQPIHAGHGDIQQHQVRAEFGAGLQGGQAILGFGHDLDAGVLAQQRTQAFAGQGFVIGNDHLHGACVLDSGERDCGPMVAAATASVILRRGAH